MPEKGYVQKKGEIKMIKKYLRNNKKQKENKRTVHRSTQTATNTSEINTTLNTINAVDIASNVPSDRCGSGSSSHDCYSSDSSSSPYCDWFNGQEVSIFGLLRDS